MLRRQDPCSTTLGILVLGRLNYEEKLTRFCVSARQQIRKNKSEFGSSFVTDEDLGDCRSAENMYMYITSAF